MKKRKHLDLPIEVYNNFTNKKNVLQDIARAEFSKPINISLTDTLRFFSQKKVYVYNEEVKNFLRKKRMKEGKLT